MSLLQIEQVSKTFVGRGHRIHALKNVTLAAQAGECLAIVGESGSGKTTLGTLILGLFEPSAGTIRFDGVTLTHRRTKAQRQAIQLVQQNPLSALNPRRSVGASIRLPLDVYGIGPRADRWGLVEQALDDVGLDPALRHRGPAALSGGQRQRVAIARALACRPRLLVLDEPTSALDVLVQARILRLLNRLRLDRGLTFVFITHDLAVVRAIADRVAVFRHGELLECATTDTLFADPQHPYTRALIAAVPVVDPADLTLRQSISEAS